MKKTLLFLTFTLIVAASCTQNKKDDFSFIGWTTSEEINGDVNNLLNFNDSQFNLSNSSDLALGYSEQDFWIKLVLNKPVNPNEEVILEFSNPMLNEIQIYSSEGTLLKDLGRINFEWNDRATFFNQFKLPSHVGQTFYVKVNSFGNNNVPINLVDSTDENWTLDERNVFFGIYFGIILAMFIYNMFLWVSTKENIYGLYISYIFFVGLTQGILGGYVDSYFFPDNDYLKEYSFYLSTVMVNIVGIYYSLRFLNIKKMSPNIFKVGLTIIGVYFFILLAFLFDFGIGQLKIRLLQIFLGIVPFYLLGISLYSLRKGYRPAKFFLFSWFLLICSMVIFLLSDLNILPHNFLTNYIFTIGSIFEALLLSFALADKINILKKEKEAEQIEKLRVLRENEDLIKEQNTKLEEKVRIRTDELEQAVRNLQNTQSQLVSQEKMASLGQLTAGIAHEINNPINFVSSNIAPLKRDIKDIMEVIEFYRASASKEFSPETKKEAKKLEEDLELDYVLDEVEQLLKGMEDGAKRTVEIVKGLRLFSRVDEQDIKKVDLHDGINSTIILLNSSIPGKIRIVRDYGELPMVECLAGKINQVFMNIINNAVHALADNLDKIADPVITIRTRALPDQVKIEIEDNGPGMPEHVRQRIFEPFFTTKPVGKGTGLGLSIVYSIIENHKGTLEVVTEEGQGTSFIISLPIYQNTPKYD